MDIKSLNEFVKFDSELDLFNLIEPNIIWINEVPGGEISYKEIEVEEHHEMRCDNLIVDMYQLEPNIAGNYLENIDVICFINNIDNPLNIRKGMILKYPANLEDFEKLRLEPSSDSFGNKNNIIEKLVLPSKSTKKDKTREKYKESGFSLPPTILQKPKQSVRIKDNGRFSIGGI